MNIEIIGTSFQNKGAELMLCAISRHFASDMPDTWLVAEWTTGSVRQRGRYGLGQKMDTRFIGRSGRLFDRLAPKAIRQHYGLFREDDIDAVLDASGFNYSDQWPLDMTRRRAKRFAEWKKRGKKIVLLPQAFGPFENGEVRDAFREIMENVDLIFARDQASHDHVVSTGGPTHHLSLAPDFTVMVDGAVPTYFDRTARQACIVPNMRMLDKTEAAVRDQYMGFLASCFRQLEQAGLKPFVLLHEIWDREVSDLLERELGRSIRILQEDDPTLLKGILGSCFLVVGSRYHALVSALCQAVPCLATGWSHKYASLMRDYECDELLLEPTAGSDQVEERLLAMTEEPARSELTQKLGNAAATQKRATEQMWSRVHEVLSGAQDVAQPIEPPCGVP